MATQTIPSPKGRFVQGDAFTAQTKDQQGNTLTIKTGPNAGQPTQRFFMAVAYPKNDPETLPYLMHIAKDAAASWPAFFPAGATMAPPMFGCSHPRFSFKITDGDGVDDNGKPNSSKEGFAGHWIVKYGSAFAPKVFEAGKYSDMERVDIDKAKHSLLKRGYYVRVGASFESNNNDQRPGEYANLQMVEIVHAGAEITSGPDGAAVFGGGATQTTTPAAAPPPPAAPAGLIPTGLGGQTIEGLRAAGWTDDAMIQAGYATRPAPAAPPVPPSPPVTPPPPPPAPTPGASGAAGATPSPSDAPPYTGYMQGGTTTPPPPPAPGRVMLPPAGTNTYEQLIAAGWTDAMLIQHGYMQA